MGTRAQFDIASEESDRTAGKGANIAHRGRLVFAFVRTIAPQEDKRLAHRSVAEQQSEQAVYPRENGAGALWKRLSHKCFPIAAADCVRSPRRLSAESAQPNL